MDNGPAEGFRGIVKTEMFQLFPVSDEESLLNAIDGERKGYPKFRSRHEHKQSCRSTNNHDSIRLTEDGRIRLPKPGEVKCRLPREPEGRILSASVIREADGKKYDNPKTFQKNRKW